MGLLDDAIREHLDLKRRRGADPADVARMEQEALGPVRREPAPAEAAAEAQQVDPPTEAAAEHQPDEHPHELAPEERHDPPHGDPLLGGAAAEAEAETGDADRAGGAEDARPPAEGPVGAPGWAGPGQTGPARHAADPELVDQPTTEYRVEDHHDDEDEHDKQPAHGEPEDVLEETPEFLQETPEHDRLWFEQRPPRDFDFDG
jgi:hypothetical protein